MKINILKPCPCGSGINYETCCQPLILGLERAGTAEQLLRSRYTAFVGEQVAYIVNTHHPEKKDDVDVAAIRDWAHGSTWQGLQILNVQGGGPDDSEGVIEFAASYTQDGEATTHHEIALFKKEGGAWYFYDVKEKEPVRRKHSIGRNDPCFCGSGKKFKKCHGKGK